MKYKTSISAIAAMISLSSPIAEAANTLNIEGINSQTTRDALVARYPNAKITPPRDGIEIFTVSGFEVSGVPRYSVLKGPFDGTMFLVKNDRVIRITFTFSRTNINAIRAYIQQQTPNITCSDKTGTFDKEGIQRTGTRCVAAVESDVIVLTSYEDNNDLTAYLYLYSKDRFEEAENVRRLEESKRSRLKNMSEAERNKLVQAAKEILTRDFKDPDSAKYRNLFLAINGFCGEVNSKNSYGGYVGYKKFYVTDGIAKIYQDDSEIKFFIENVRNCSSKVVDIQ